MTEEWPTMPCGCAALTGPCKHLIVEWRKRPPGERTFAEIRSLKARIAELEKELEESARLHGIGGSREARLLAQVAELEAERDTLKKCLFQMQEAAKSATERVSTLSHILRSLIEWSRERADDHDQYRSWVEAARHHMEQTGQDSTRRVCACGAWNSDEHTQACKQAVQDADDYKPIPPKARFKVNVTIGEIRQGKPLPIPDDGDTVQGSKVNATGETHMIGCLLPTNQKAGLGHACEDYGREDSAQDKNDE